MLGEGAARGSFCHVAPCRPATAPCRPAPATAPAPARLTGSGRTCSLWQQKLADQESKGKAFASEIRQLRTELEDVLKKSPPVAPLPSLDLPSGRPAPTGPGPLSVLARISCRPAPDAHSLPHTLQASPCRRARPVSTCGGFLTTP